MDEQLLESQSGTVCFGAGGVSAGVSVGGQRRRQKESRLSAAVAAFRYRNSASRLADRPATATSRAPYSGATSIT